MLHVLMTFRCIGASRACRIPEEPPGCLSCSGYLHVFEAEMVSWMTINCMVE